MFVGSSLFSIFALELPNPNMPPRPPCMRLNSHMIRTKKISIGSRKPSVDIRNESCVTSVVYLSTPSAPETFSKTRSAARAGYCVMTSLTSSVSSTLMPSFSVRRSLCSRSSICASATLPASICCMATDVSTSRNDRVSSVRVVTAKMRRRKMPTMPAIRKTLFLSMEGLGLGFLGCVGPLRRGRRRGWRGGVGVVKRRREACC